MKATILRSAIAVIFMIATQAVHAQAVITEYFDVKEAVKFDLSDKKATKAVYTKGVLDIDWNSDKRVLAISYDPKLIKIEDIMSHVHTVTGITLDPTMASNAKKRN
jgi:hypothetical protein